MRVVRCLALIGLATGCRKGSEGAAPTPPGATAALSSPTLELAVSQPPDDELRIELTVLNRTSGPLWMNGRMASNHRRSLEFEREVWFELTRENGDEVPFHCVVDNLPPHDEDYIVLRPGSSLKRSFSLNCFDLSPGRYRIIGFYMDGNPHPPRPPAGAVPLREMLVSAQRRFEVRP